MRNACQLFRAECLSWLKKGTHDRDHVLHFPQNQKDFNAFSAAYRLDGLVYALGKRHVLKDWRKDGIRRCRFCRRSEAEGARFGSDAHFIPQFLGNRYILSENECDSCNVQFSVYETHFASYLGIANTITRTKNKKNKVPKFKDASQKFVVAEEEVLEMRGVMMTDLKPTGFNINLETGEVVIPYLKPGYIPVKAFKCLLKMAMSLMPAPYLVDYRELLEVLLTDINDHKLASVAKVIEFWLPAAAPEPRVMLFVKNDARERLFTHIFQVYFHHKLFQLAVPLRANDLWFYNGTVQNQLFCPPLFHHRVEGQPLAASVKDFSGTEKVSEEEALFFSTDPAYLTELVSYDPVTKTHKPANFKPEEIVRIMFVDRDQKIGLKD